MTPIPQNAPHVSSPPLKKDGNRIVISGMSGLYPQANNINEFADILYNKVNPVTSEDIRFSFNHPEVVQYSGTIPGLSYFDAHFFKVHYRLANAMDPMSRKLLEQTYNAIYDAGINPEDLSGKKIGVYIGSCFSENEKARFYESNLITGFGIPGSSRSMYANRISYWLNAKGPSMAIDAACSSSTAALEQAYQAMNRGECEAAIVGGAFICLHPQSSVHYGRVLKTSSDGKTKSFDQNACGCAKSEAVNVLFLQRAKDALRIYAEVLHAKSEFTCLLKTEIGPKYGLYRDLNSSTDFLETFYKEAKIPQKNIEYVEAFGSAISEVDKVELQVFENVFCKNRDDSLLVGSVTSNIGYAEAASGISSITKVLLGYHRGQLAANLHCDQPREDIKALQDGRMRIVTEHQHFDRSYVGVNSISVTGVNCHVLLHGNYKHKDLNRYTSSIPHLVTISARHEEAVKYVLDVLKSSPVDAEQLALLHNIHQKSILGHMGRGFTILRTDEDKKTISISEKVEYFNDVKRPLWFVYSGMGSQWAGMGVQLMRIPIFVAAIERCRNVLEPKGLDIVKIITSDDETMFDNILHSFVGIAAIQIGLTDILHALGLKPDGLIGHSVGELGCAYADGCLTAEEMILSAYYRGLVSLETELIHGSMAAVGLGYEKISKMCPPEIEVACHNGPESSTLSGPSDAMREFVTALTSIGIFAKEVPSAHIAYHSRYIANAGPGLLKYLKRTIQNPKARSERWLSTSVPQDKWDEPVAKLCSAEYLTNNLLNSVLFEETSRLVPSNAVLVEIAPHGLLQAILKRSMPASCRNIPLTRRNHSDNVVLLLEAIGKLYIEGYNCDVKVLYPKVEMPVSTGTPFLSHFVKWAHGEKWPLPLYRSANRKTAASCNYILSIHDKEHEYLRGNKVRGNTLYPFAASLSLVWDTLAMVLNVPKKELSVKFSDLELLSQPNIHDQRQLNLNVSIHRGAGYFEVLNDGSKILTGFITPHVEETKYDVIYDHNNKIYFNTEDIYQMLRDRDYFYSDEFRSIAGADESLNNAELMWCDNWITLIDGMLQLCALKQPHNAVSQPKNIRRVNIDTNAHNKAIQNSKKSDSTTLLKANLSDEHENIRCGGVLIETIKYHQLPPYMATAMALKSLKFVSHFDSGFDVSSSLEVYLQIVAENLNKSPITVVGIRSKVNEECMFKKINDVTKNIFQINVDYKEYTREIALESYKFNDADLILVGNLSGDTKMCQRFEEVLPKDKFIVSEECIKKICASVSSTQYRVLSLHNTKDQIKLRLIRWGGVRPLTAITTVSVRQEADFGFLASVRNNLSHGQHLLVTACHPTPRGLKELISSWRNESVKNKVNLITINNSSNDIFEEKIHDINLAFNNITNGKWGGEYFLSVNPSTKKSHNVLLDGGQIEDYDSLKWINVSDVTGSGITVNVHFAAINKNDLKKVNGSLLFKKTTSMGYGMDFSGIMESGKRVMGIVNSCAVSTQVKVQPELVWPVPSHWNLEDAATVPLAYVQAFYCLAIKCQVPKGKRVFVHGGAGALGQAIISILLALDCEIFTTVSDIRKKKFLQKLYPELKADHIGCSRDHTFGEMVNIISEGKQCDVVINCVKDKLKDVSVNRTAFGGLFLDISQLQDEDDYKFGMFFLNNERSYLSVDFSSIFETKNLADLQAIQKMVSEGIAMGYVRPLSRVTYAPHEVPRAFRLLASSSHRGRVLIRMREDTIQAQYRLRCRAHHSNLIICGKTEFGLQFADRIVNRGAKQICLHVPAQTSYLEQKIRFWQRLGVRVIVSSEPLNSQNAIVPLLNSSLSLGPLEGVYIVAEETTTDNDFIKNVDAELRRFKIDLSYFAVINLVDSSTAKNICLNRLRTNLPATELSFPEIKAETYSSYMNWRGAMDALEHALHSDHGLIIAHENKNKPSLLEQITKFTGICVPDSASYDVTLKELGIQNHQLQPLSTFLRIQHNLAYSDEQILSLTINKILEIEKTIQNFPRENTKGLSTFFNYIDADELLATTEMVFMPTIVGSASMLHICESQRRDVLMLCKKLCETGACNIVLAFPTSESAKMLCRLRDDEFKSDQINLCIVPGMEGYHGRFRTLCQRLKLPALVLQPDLDHPHETILETAQRFAEVLLKKTGMKDAFYLLGYESGIYIALELAAILEDHGLSGKVFCLGCTPEEFETELEEQLSSFENEQQLQDGVLRHMYSLMSGCDTSGLEDMLQNLSTWSQKIEVCVRTLLGRVSHSAQYARSLIECALARIVNTRRHKFTFRPLRSQVILLRAASDRKLGEDTVLHRVSQQPLIVHQLASPLAHVTTDLHCTAIINNHLDPTILNKFEATNICDTYLMNANSFMSLDR